MRFIVIYTFNSIIFQCGGGGHVGTGPEDGTVFNLNIKVWFTARHKQHNKHFPASPLPLLYMFYFWMCSFSADKRLSPPAGELNLETPSGNNRTWSASFSFIYIKKTKKTTFSGLPVATQSRITLLSQERGGRGGGGGDGGDGRWREGSPASVHPSPPPSVFFLFCFFCLTWQSPWV